jgi:hypothetical protein
MKLRRILVLAIIIAQGGDIEYSLIYFGLSCSFSSIWLRNLGCMACLKLSSFGGLRLFLFGILEVLD